MDMPAVNSLMPLEKGWRKKEKNKTKFKAIISSSGKVAQDHSRNVKYI